MSEKEELEKNDSKYSKNKQMWITFITGMVVIIIALVITFGFVIGVSKVDGESMTPTMTNGERVLFYRLDKDFSRGEIVSIHMPSGENYVKRIIGVAGDSIDIRDGAVYVNDKKLDEPYIKGTTKTQSDLIDYPFVVDENRVFVMGDNREGSVDSRSFGEVSVKSILGKIMGQ